MTDEDARIWREETGTPEFDTHMQFTDAQVEALVALAGGNTFYTREAMEQLCRLGYVDPVYATNKSKQIVGWILTNLGKKVTEAM